MSVQVESLELDIKSNAAEAASGLDKLASTMKKLQGVTSAESLKNISESLSEISKALEKTPAAKNLATLANALKKLEGIKISESTAASINSFTEALDSESLSNINADGINKLANAMGRLGNTTVSPDIAGQIINIAYAADQISEGTAQRIKDLADSFRALKSQQLSQRTFDTGMRVNEPVMIDTTQSELSLYALRNAAYAAKNAVGGIAGAAIGFGSSIVSGAKNAMSALSSLGDYIKGQFQSAVKNATSGFTKFASTFQRIAVYRAFRAAISAITSAVKEGINNVYYYSQLIGGTFASSMDSLASSAQYLKNSLGAMVSPLISAVAPAINYVIDLLVDLFNTINMVFARLSGSSTYTRAVRNATSYGSALDDVGSAASGAADAIDDATTGIDELNIITQPTSGSGGGGGGGGGSGYGSMFEEVAIDSDIIDFVDKLKDAFNAGDWETLGTLLGEKVNEIVDSIDWAGLGQKFGYYLNGAIQTAYYFLKEVDFVNIGSKVATFLNNALEQIDSEYIGRLLVRKITAGLDFLGGLLGTLDWGLVTSKISSGIIGAFKEATEWLQEKDWYEIGQTLVNKLADAFNGVDWDGLATSFFTLLGEAIGSAYELIKGIADGVAEKLGDYFEEYTTNEDGTKKSGLAWVEGICQGILDGIGNIVQWIKENVVVPFLNGLCDALGIEGDYSTETMSAGEAIINGLEQGLLKAMTGVSDWIYEHTVGPIISSLEEAFGIEGDTATTTEEVGENAAYGFLYGFSDNFLGINPWIYDNLVEPVIGAINAELDINGNESGLTKDIGEYTGEGLLSGLMNSIVSADLWVKEHITDPLCSGFNSGLGTEGGESTVTKEIGEYVGEGLLTGMEEKTTDAPSWIEEHVVNPIKNAFETLFGISSPSTVMMEYGGYLMEGLQQGIENNEGGVETTISAFASDVLEWFGTTSGLVEGIAEVGSKIITGFSEKVASTYTNAQSSITAWAQGVKSWFSKDVNETTFGTYATNIVTGFTSTVGNTYSSSNTPISAWALGVNTWFTEDGKVNKDTFRTYASDIVTSFTETVQDEYTNSEAPTTTWAEGVKTWFTDIVNVENWTTFATDVITAFAETISSLYTNSQAPMTDWATNVVNWFKDTASSNTFYQIASDVIDGFNRGITELYYKTEKVMREWASDLAATFENELDVASPSKLFYSIGGFVVEGFNEAIDEIGATTAGVVDSWVASFTDIEPQLAYTGDVTTPSVTVNDGTDIKSFYLEYIEPLLLEIAADTKRQADKEEKTVLNVSGRQIASTVTQQYKVNGYAFRS